MTDNYELEHFRSRVTTSNQQGLMAFNAGQYGQLSRVLNKVLTPTTHPLLPSLAAPGQLSAAEINSALHIIGESQKYRFYSVGSALPSTLFFQKLFNELGMQHQHTTLEQQLSMSNIASMVKENIF